MHNNRYTLNKALNLNATHIEKKAEDNKHKNNKKQREKEGFPKGVVMKMPTNTVDSLKHQTFIQNKPMSVCVFRCIHENSTYLSLF